MDSLEGEIDYIDLTYQISEPTSFDALRLDVLTGTIG